MQREREFSSGQATGAVGRAAEACDGYRLAWHPHGALAHYTSYGLARVSLGFALGSLASVAHRLLTGVRGS
jgi:hypothetical protein